MAQLGRIGGPLLEQNLRRDNVDLKFSNTTYDSTSTLYLNVTDGRIGVNTNVPGFDLDINNDIKTTNVIVDNTAKIDNVIIQAPSSFTTRVGPINILPVQNNPEIYLQRMRSDDLDFNDNTISGLNTNQSIDLVTSGTGEIDVTSSSNVYGNMGVTGNTTIDGNLTHAENIILGDELYDPDLNELNGDTIEIIPDFSQSIIPGDDNTWNLGTNEVVDSTVRRWNNAYITDNLVNTDTVLPNEIRVSDQISLNGVTNEIFALQSNDDVLLSPDTGITFIENTKWEGNYLTNLLNTPLQFRSTGIGYIRFMGDNGFVIPAGDNSTRPTRPELGDTRWNTDEERLEAFAGLIEVVTAIGVLTGLPDQVATNLSGATDGNGENAQFSITVTSGSLANITITNQGQGYSTNDTITIPGTAFTGGATPTNDVVVTVGAQTDDGYNIATGGGAEVDVDLMEELGNEYSLILG